MLEWFAVCTGNHERGWDRRRRLSPNTYQPNTRRRRLSAIDSKSKWLWHPARPSTESRPRSGFSQCMLVNVSTCWHTIRWPTIQWPTTWSYYMANASMMWLGDWTLLDGVASLHWLILGVTSSKKALSSTHWHTSEVTFNQSRSLTVLPFELGFGSWFEGLTISIKISIKELHTLCVD